MPARKGSVVRFTPARAALLALFLALAALLAGFGYGYATLLCHRQPGTAALESADSAGLARTMKDR